MDYTHIAGTATITAGNTGTTVNITTLSDAIYESDETFQMVLSSPSANATISDST
ncbi:MAG: hypothetical protein Q8O99_05080 [bacterium]|nr:hypothetical protein [bacterium]